MAYFALISRATDYNIFGSPENKKKMISKSGMDQSHEKK